MRRLTLLFMLMAFCLSTSFTFAATMATVNNATLSTTMSNLPAEKKTIVEKFKAKVAKAMLKKDGDGINIPGSAKTWLIYTIVLVIASIVLAILPGGVGILSSIAYSLSGIAFLIWVLKYFKILD